MVFCAVIFAGVWCVVVVVVLAVVFLWWCGGVFVGVWWCFCGIFVVVFLCFCGGVFVCFLIRGRLSSQYREVMQRVLTTLV